MLVVRAGAFSTGLWFLARHEKQFSITLRQDPYLLRHRVALALV
jgi:hypothetical protein